MGNTPGYFATILWVDLHKKSPFLESRDELFWRCYAGGGFAACVLLIERLLPGADPLGPEIPLIFASNVVGGHLGARLARFTVSSKSPLTCGIGETRTEGPFGVALKESGADIIVFTGTSDTPTIVSIENGVPSFCDAARQRGRSVGEACDELEGIFGKECHIVAIGPAGENLVRFVAIVTDRTYQATRMGMGAVMGSKKLKALVIGKGRRIVLHDQAAMDGLTADYAVRISRNDLSNWQLRPPGFSGGIYLHGKDAALHVNNYSECSFPWLEAFEEERFLEREIREPGCPGCPNNCIKAILPKDLRGLDPRACGIHQEVTGTMGVNIGVGDWTPFCARTTCAIRWGSMRPPSVSHFPLRWSFSSGASSPLQTMKARRSASGMQTALSKWRRKSPDARGRRTWSPWVPSALPSVSEKSHGLLRIKSKG
jgi:aldehyde:ferredoxin oxidoreductase